MKKPLKTPNINKKMFWDVDVNKLDYRRHGAWIIVRVFNYGNDADATELVNYYGPDYVTKVLTLENILDAPAYHRGIALLHIPPTEFKCYGKKLRQQNYMAH